MGLIFARLKRKHPTWAVWVYLFVPFDKQRELARSRWKWWAILNALRAPVSEGR